jgi:signal transduction histidine kinase
VIGLRRALWAIAVAGVVAGVAAVALVLTSHSDDQQTAHLVFGPLIAWSFIGTGLYAWWQRPDNHFGFLMTAVGFSWIANALSDSSTPGVFVVGYLAGALPFGFLIHLLLAFPAGRLEGRMAKGLALWAWFQVTVGQLATVLVTDTKNGDCRCATNPLLLTHDKGVADAVAGFVTITSVLGLITIAAFLGHRYRRAGVAQRRALGPMYLAGAVTMVLLSITLAADVTSFDNEVEAAVDLASNVALLAVPFGFLLGLMRTRMARGGGVSDLITRVGSPRDGAVRMRDLLAESLEDPSLELAYWLPERGVFVSEDGRETDLPENHPGRSVTEVTRDGERVAAIVHDPALDDSRDLVRGAGAAVALALENERLDAELRARLEELRASRERLVRAGLDERRRLERDLHDGAQQRLVSLRLALGLLKRAAATDPAGAERLVEGAVTELDAALAELRELARGIHPGVLSDHGLEPALSALADRAPLPVDVDAEVARLPQAVESAAYFTVAEALTNVAKYAHAHAASVSVAAVNGHVVVEVRDDGVGGADPSRGTGLRGLADRVAALGGRLDVESPSGAGTTLRAEIPCA